MKKLSGSAAAVTLLLLVSACGGSATAAPQIVCQSRWPAVVTSGTVLMGSGGC